MGDHAGERDVERTEADDPPIEEDSDGAEPADTGADGERANLFELGAGRSDDERTAASSEPTGGETPENGRADPFEDDFASELEDVDLPGLEEGGGSLEGFGDIDFGVEADRPDFDEELDSDIPRIDLGIDGLDRMIQGGVPERTLMVAIGSAGTGKTTFGLQFLAHGLRQGENVVFIALEERRERVLTSATEKGYAFDEYEEEGQLAIVDIDPVEMASSLASIRGELPALIEEFGASRLVLDSVSLLEMMYEDRSTRRNEIYEFTQAVKEAGVTALLTSEASEDTPYASRHGIVEYLTDAVFVLQYVRPDDFRDTRLAVEIQKIRDANHSREKKPYELTAEGIAVYEQANLF